MLFSIVFVLTITLVMDISTCEKWGHANMGNTAYLNKSTGLYNKNYLRDQMWERMSLKMS